jgi:outer membrane murein-binding lipoprotein Lpp
MTLEELDHAAEKGLISPSKYIAGVRELAARVPHLEKVVKAQAAIAQAALAELDRIRSIGRSAQTMKVRAKR